MKYYFIRFMYGASEKLSYNDAIDHHPFEWQKHGNKSYPGQYILKDWKEISKEEYEAFKDSKEV